MFIHIFGPWNLATVHPPALLALQKLAVGGDLYVQGQLGTQHCLVISQQLGQVLLILLESLFQFLKLLLGVLESPFSSLLCIRNQSVNLFDLDPSRVGEHRGVELLESDLGLMGCGVPGEPTLSPVLPAS